jgi:organic radical activating enzyme
VIPQQAAHLVEMFSSVQGEGVYVGASTLFVRFAECDLRCRWCDTPHSWLRRPVARLETERGSGEFREVANPVALADLIEAAEVLQLTSHRFVSFTGGEPLLQPEPLAALARAFRGRGPRIHLETHGLHTAALEAVLPEIDVVSMDWKLASDVRRASDPKAGAIDDYHAAHAEFLRLALAAPEVMVKVVITESSRDHEIDEMIAQLVGISPEVMVIVQPVTPFGGIATAPSARRLLDLTRRIEQQLPNVRLIPQTHHLYGAL